MNTYNFLPHLFPPLFQNPHRPSLSITCAPPSFLHTPTPSLLPFSILHEYFLFMSTFESSSFSFSVLSRLFLILLHLVPSL
jgi:hypothetical protein